MRWLSRGHGSLRLNGGALALWVVIALALAGCSLGATPQPGPTPTATATTEPFPTTTPPTGPMTCLGAFDEVDPVAAENTCPGTTAWRQNLPLGPDHAIEGYVSSASVAAGQVVRLYVSTTAASYTYAVYRMGYYHGRGARLIYQSHSIKGIQQPAPTIDPINHTVECVWSHPVSIATQRSWVSGVYVVKLVTSDKYMRYTLFVVRNATVRAPILYLLPFLTYQAYNLWGGFSLYRGIEPDGVTLNPALRSYAVSFDRPYMKDGLSTFALYDLPLLSWMESRGYNMAYAADFNLDSMTGSVSQYKLFVISGHAEYWSTGMRTNALRVRDSGVSLAFFGGNDEYWHVRLQPSPLGSDREVICYKHGYYHDGTRNSTDPFVASDPSAATVIWHDKPLNLPERLLLGEMFGGGPGGYQPLTLAPGSAPYLMGTSLAVGSVFPRLVGGEYDRLVPASTPANVRVIAASPIRCSKSDFCPKNMRDTADSTIYTAASGAQVFDAGTFTWAWALSDISGPGAVQGTNAVAVLQPSTYVNPGFQQFTANILSALLAS